MGKPKKFKGDIDVSCMLCLEKRNRAYELNKKLTETVEEVLCIKVENIIKLPKRICYRCYFIMEYFSDFRNVTIRNITVAENKLTEDNSSVIYDKPLMFNIISDKILKEQNLPYSTEIPTWLNGVEEKSNDILIVPLTHQELCSYQNDHLIYQQSIFPCRYCTVTYNKKTSLVHHERKHIRELKRERCRSRSSKRSKRYACEDCDNETVFTKLTELKQHKKTHITKLSCRLGCGTNFDASMERDNHESICNDRFSKIDFDQSRVFTRSRSRLSTVSNNRSSSCGQSHASVDNSDCDSDDMWDSVSTRMENNINKRNSRTKSCNSSCVSKSCTMSDCSQASSSKSSFRNKTLLNNKSKEGPSVQSVRGPTGFIPRTIEESITYIRNHEPLTESTKFYCRKCAFNNHNVDVVSQHEQRRHKIEPWFPCNECTKAFTNKQLLDAHKNIAHVRGPFICALCSQVHLSQHNLQLHLHDHRCMKNHYCVCDKKFLTEEELFAHLESETDERHIEYRSQFSMSIVVIDNNDDVDPCFKIVDSYSLSGSRAGTPAPKFNDDQTSEHSDNEDCIDDDSTVQQEPIDLISE